MALLGSYCSEQQELMLKRLGDGLILALDNDEAGREATVRMVEKFKRTVLYQNCLFRGRERRTGIIEKELSTAINQAYYPWRT